MSIRQYLTQYRQRQHVRPWALSVPILILLIALPLLRPLRHQAVSAEEAATLSAIQSIVEDGSSIPPLAIPDSSIIDTRMDRPVFVFLLAGPYWVMHHFGLRFSTNPILVSYLLTVIGVTLPAALSAGLIYRMGRMFELKRPWRTALAASAVFASGLFAYATVLNPQVPSAFAVLWASACLIHVAVVGHPNRSGAWLTLAGLLAAMASVLEPAAIAFLLLLPLVILAMRWAWSLRIAGVMLFAFGALPPLALHLVLTSPDPVARVHEVVEGSRQYWSINSQPDATPSPAGDEFDESALQPSPIAVAITQFFALLFGTHGLFSHFPIMLLAVIGIAAVMHRHWPTPTKMLAAVTLAGALLIILLHSNGIDLRARNAPFASRWCLVFAPLLLFWCGAWLRRSHHPATWTVVGVLLAISTAVSLIGATNPLPPAGYGNRYTAVAAFKSLIHPNPQIDPAKALTTISTEPTP